MRILDVGGSEPNTVDERRKVNLNGLSTADTLMGRHGMRLHRGELRPARDRAEFAYRIS